MHVGIAGPVSIGSLRHLIPCDANVPKTYSFPLVAELVSKLVSLGHRVTVFAGSDEIETPREVQSDSLTIVFLPRRKTKQAYDGYRFERLWLERALRDSKCDLIHAHWCYEFAAASLSCGKPCLVTVHDSPRLIAQFYWKTKAALFWAMRSLLGRSVLKRARFVSGVSPYILENVRPLMKCVKLARVIPNGVDERIFEMCANRPELPGDDGDFNVYSILQDFGVRKNATAAIAAFSMVKRVLPNAKYHLIGSDFEIDGPAHRWATKNGLDKGCRFRGFVGQSRLFEEICLNAHVVLHPSIEESFGMAILEATAIGIPVVASKSAGGPSYLLDEGRLGTLVDVTCVNEIADAVLKISRFPKEARIMALKCRELAHAKFTLTKMTEQYLHFYSNILASTHI